MDSQKVRNNALNMDGRPSPHWDISQERAFVENLLGQQLNFMIVFFTVVIGAAINSQEKPLIQAIIMFVGAPIVVLLSSVIMRTQEKLDIILNLIWTTDPEHPSCVTNRLSRPKGSRRKVIGYYIPSICSTVVLCALLYATIRTAILFWSR